MPKGFLHADYFAALLCSSKRLKLHKKEVKIDRLFKRTPQCHK